MGIEALRYPLPSIRDKIIKSLGYACGAGPTTTSWAVEIRTSFIWGFLLDGDAWHALHSLSVNDRSLRRSRADEHPDPGSWRAKEKGFW
jgi:hypothetical protein